MYGGRILTATEVDNIYQYNAVAGSGQAFGDPHITTLNNLTYKFNYLGPFRLFDNNAKELNNRLIINGYSMNGVGRWKDKQYIKLVYIFYGGKETVIDTGFRGQKVKILNNHFIECCEYEEEN